jgi:N,N'-diacetylchitobiose phosphorylase
VRPEVDGLRIDPCIPSHWDSFAVERRFRNKLVKITVTNANGVCRGVQSVTLNGVPLADNLIPADWLQAVNEVQVVLGH